MAKHADRSTEHGSEPVGTTNRDICFCSGKVAVNIDLRVDTSEMENWPIERIDALFDGLAKVQRAMAGTLHPEDMRG